MYIDDRGDHNYYFLGQDNGTIFYTMPAVLFNTLYSIEKRGKVTLLPIMVTVVIGSSYFYVGSGNGRVAFVILLAFQLLLNTKNFYKKKCQEYNIEYTDENLNYIMTNI